MRLVYIKLNRGATEGREGGCQKLYVEYYMPSSKKKWLKGSLKLYHIFAKSKNISSAVVTN